MLKYGLLLLAIMIASAALAQERENSNNNQVMVIGPKNLNLHKGAQALLDGRAEEGIEYTLKGLGTAQGVHEEKAAISNLCSGYTVLERYDEAMKYCEQLIERDEKAWRAYNNRALIYIMTGQYGKAEQDLIRVEQLKPGAPTLKVARALYRDAVDPVVPEVTIKDK